MIPELCAVVLDSVTADAELRAGLHPELEALAVESAGVAIRTCQRLELYVPRLTAAPPEGARVLWGEEAARHLLRVAAGLESSVTGEDEILHQVREALASAGRRRVDGGIRRLFETAIGAGRKARTGPRPAHSLADYGVEWLGGGGGGGRLLVVGAGMMGSAVAAAARRRGTEIVIASRTTLHARRLAEKLGGGWVTLEEAARLAVSAPIVAIALSGPWRQLQQAPGGLVLDLSSPSALVPDLQTALGSRLLGIDALLRMVPEARGMGAASYSRRAEPLVEAALTELVSWHARRRLWCAAAEPAGAA